MPVPQHWPDVPREVKNMIARVLVERMLERTGNFPELLKAFYVWTVRDGARVETFVPVETLYAFAREDAGMAPG